ncbi:MAG TPA: HAMP domain-containing sensor histidine kinase [Stackebrandtia sp.]|uniref:sensor histidine kinase n=1 Tax=Stackebrandtia sp. TaxID=2023065 RepID=UPI002D6DCFF1|nr:HAMP domain-containing sensor histidine kinase [Stackebrandtia sp.]HZE39986.1 HAMP domain-containing sensor histidine kinase [Stackebrandtia sp.]
MTLKSRLVLATAGLLCLATVGIGAIAISTVTADMIDRVDDQLRRSLAGPNLDSQSSEAGIITEKSGEGIRSTRQDILYQAFATRTTTLAGDVVKEVSAGYSGDLLSAPAWPKRLVPHKSIQTVPSADGTFDYRMLVHRVKALTPAGSAEYLFAVAAPLNEVVTVRNRLINTMVLTVLAIASLGALAAWWITRRGLRPVDDMVAAATAIADGDLERRASVRGGQGELGHLAKALNIMVSKLVRALSQREAERNRLRAFIADASHELRTPLATVSGYTELYESGGAPPGPDLDRAMSRIRAENKRMASLVDDLLLLARLDQETVDDRAPCDLSILANDCAEDARIVDPTRPVTTHITDGVMVSANASRLHQVVGNLLGNIRQHTPEGTRISVSVSREDGFAWLTVADDGPGIAPEHRDKVFDRLYRVDPSRSRATGGSGLGLSIVDSIVRAHGGRVWLESRVKAGTKVHLTLPTIADNP